jgi:hypothetical protein
MTVRDEISLYGLLAEHAPESAEPGETLTTRRKETIDDDRETFDLPEAGLDRS